MKKSLNDRHNQLARTLRTGADAARVQPSPQLRQRTLAMLRDDAATAPAPLPFPRPRRVWPLLSAAAAMLALAAIAAWALRPQSPSMLPPPHDLAHNNPASRSPSQNPNRLPLDRAAAFTANVRLASLTRPLQREAENLQSDFRRAVTRVRSNLPGLSDSSHRTPATQSDPNPSLNPSS